MLSKWYLCRTSPQITIVWRWICFRCCMSLGKNDCISFFLFCFFFFSFSFNWFFFFLLRMFNLFFYSSTWRILDTLFVLIHSIRCHVYRDTKASNAFHEAFLFMHLFRLFFSLTTFTIFIFLFLLYSFCCFRSQTPTGQTNYHWVWSNM